MEQMRIQVDGPEGSVATPLEVFVFTNEEFLQLALRGSLASTGLASTIIFAVNNDPESIRQMVLESVGKRYGHVEVFDLGGGDEPHVG